jgi:hypothetical protein
MVRARSIHWEMINMCVNLVENLKGGDLGMDES